MVSTGERGEPKPEASRRPLHVCLREARDVAQQYRSCSMQALGLIPSTVQRKTHLNSHGYTDKKIFKSYVKDTNASLKYLRIH